MKSSTIVLEENGFPVELVSDRDIERSVAGGRLRPDSLITLVKTGEAPRTMRAAEFERLRPFFERSEMEISQPQPVPTGEALPYQEPLDGSDLNPLDEEPRSGGFSYGPGGGLRDNSARKTRTVYLRNNSAVRPDRQRTPDNDSPGALQYALAPLKRYAELSGRSSRREFWSFAALLFGLLFVAVVISGGSDAPTGAAFLALFALALVVPSFTVSVRRLHDFGVTGWVLLLSFIPYVGPFIILGLMCMPSQAAANAYGPKPQEGA
jgi:uncharacterized membrane protein YhaH (DUF805 family)